MQNKNLDIVKRERNQKISLTRTGMQFPLRRKNFDSQENYWDAVALEAEKGEALVAKTDEWPKNARNWLVLYAEKKAYDFVTHVVQTHIKLKSNAQILDVGCGVGKWVNFFVEKGFATTGIDSSPWMIKVAKKRIKREFENHVRFCVMNVAKLNLPTNSYDMVNCITVLQHILNDEDWRNAIHEMIRVTKPLGYVLIFEAAPSFILIKRTRHLRFRTMEEYISEFRRAGAHLINWRATDLSYPITFLGLRKYASSFNKKVYYYFSVRHLSFLPNFLSLLSRMAALMAKPMDYKLTETPLGLLSLGKILLFRKART